MESDDRRAGAIILKDLALFNKAALYMETEIEPAVRTAMGQLFGEWCKSRQWGGEADESDDFEYWVAPPQWRAEVGTEEWVAWFNFENRTDDSNSYLLANLAGVGDSPYGLKFKVDHRSFGGTRLWNIYAKTLGEFGEQLGERGWTHEGKGTFFQPVLLPTESLVDAWENEDWSEALSPITRSLDALEAVVPIFEAMVNGAKREARRA